MAAGALYLAAVLHGLVLVTVPALAPQLRAALGLTDAAWGAVFLPQMLASFGGSLLSGAVARRVGLRALLVASLVLAAVAEAVILSSPRLGYPALLAATGLVGLAFGVSAAPLNAGPPALFPRHLDASVAGVHVAFGVGLSGGPALAAVAGWSLPPALMVSAAALAVAACFVTLPDVAVAAVKRVRATAEPAFWMLVAALVLYGCAEATFSNWVVVYLVEERHLPPAAASLALSAFWSAITAGRAASIVLLWRVPAARVVGWLPVLTAIAFLAAPAASSLDSALVLFGFAGLACSAFVPMVLALGVRRFPDEGAAVSAALVAAIGAGLGVGAVVAGLLREGRTLADVYRLAAVYPLLVLALLAVLRSRGDLRRT